MFYYQSCNFNQMRLMYNLRILCDVAGFNFTEFFYHSSLICHYFGKKLYIYYKQV